MTSTAILRTANLVWGLSAAFGLKVITTRPNSVKASFMSLIRIRSLVLFETLLSFSLPALKIGSRVSSTDDLPLLLLTPPVALRPPFPTDCLEVAPRLGIAGMISGAVDEGCSIVKGSEKNYKFCPTSHFDSLVTLMSLLIT